MVSPPSDDWEVDVSITDPYGAVDSSDYIYDAEAAVGSESVHLCGDGMDRPGTYTITATLTWYDAEYNTHIEAPVSTEFTLVRPTTVTTMTVSDKRPDFNEKVVFRTKSTVQARIGYARLEYERVRLEAYLKGAWRLVDATTTDGDGLAKFRYRWNIHRPRIKVRAVTVATASINLSASVPVTIRVT